MIEYAKMDVVGFFLYISKNYSVVLWITSVIKNVISLNYVFFVRERLEFYGWVVSFYVFNSYLTAKVINIV